MQFVNSWKYIQKLFGQKLDRSYAVLTSYQSLHVLSMNFPLSQFRVATHQKVKNSLTFHWSLNSFHWPFINEKQSMFTFTLAFLLAINIFLFIFNLSRLLRKEEGIWKKAFTTKTTDHNYYMCQALSVKLIALQHTFHLLRKKKNAFQSLEENLWTINQKTEFPYFSLTLTISKIFPDLEKVLFFPDHGNPAVVP